MTSDLVFTFLIFLQSTISLILYHPWIHVTDWWNLSFWVQLTISAQFNPIPLCSNQVLCLHGQGTLLFLSLNSTMHPKLRSRIQSVGCGRLTVSSVHLHLLLCSFHAHSVALVNKLLTYLLFYLRGCAHDSTQEHYFFSLFICLLPKVGDWRHLQSSDQMVYPFFTFLSNVPTGGSSFPSWNDYSFTFGKLLA